MAVVSYKDADGTERWADEHSKAYEKHLKSTGEVKAAEPAKAEAPQPNPAPRVVDAKPVEAKKA